MRAELCYFIGQVIHREAQFRFGAYREQLKPALARSSWQCGWLAELLSEHSLRLARHPLVLWLKHRAHNPVLGPLCRLALQPASPVRGVPVYGKNIRRRPETLNLRLLSYYPVLLGLLLLAYRLLSLLFHSLF